MKSLLLLFYIMNAGGLKAQNGLAPQVRVPVELKFLQNKEISSDYLYLEDLTTCIGMKTICSEVNSIYIGLSPQPGMTSIITSKSILTYVNEEMPKLLIKLSGSDAVKISSKFQEIDLDQLKSRLQREIDALDYMVDLRIEVSSIRLKNRSKLRPGNIVYIFPDLRQYFDSLFKRSHHYNFSRELCIVAQSEYQKVISSQDICIRPKFDFKYWAPVAVSKLISGTTLKNEYFKMDWVSSKKDIVRDTESLVGKKLKRIVIKGSPVRERYLEYPYLVKRGQDIDVLFDSGGLIVRGRAKVLSSGRLGDSISLRLNNSKKIARGKILSKNEVEVVR